MKNSSFSIIKVIVLSALLLMWNVIKGAVSPSGLMQEEPLQKTETIDRHRSRGIKNFTRIVKEVIADNMSMRKHSTKPGIEKVGDFPIEDFPEYITQLLLQNRCYPRSDLVWCLIDRGIINIPVTDRKYIRVKNLEESVGSPPKQCTILIGVVKPQAMADSDKVISGNESVTWLYLFKETTSQEELQGISAAYQYMQDRNIKQNGYRLKFAWHEKLWKGPETYFELLHCAQGKLLHDYECECFSGLLSRWGINLTFDKKGKIFLGEDPQYLKKYEDLKSAYFGFGSVIGKFFKLYQATTPVVNGELFSIPRLDPHEYNIFFDYKTKTIWWVDLEQIGPSYYQNEQEDTGAGASQMQVMVPKTIDFCKPLRELALFDGALNPPFKEAVDRLFPNYKTDDAIMRTLIDERNRMFNIVREVQEAFTDVFISNWASEYDRAMLRDYFKRAWIYPYSTPAQCFQDTSSPFIFANLHFVPK